MTRSTPIRAGRFRQGRIAEGRPHSLDAWRVTTDDAQVAARIAHFQGGEFRSNDGGGQHAYEVLTTRESVRILMDGPDAVSLRMVRWSMNRLIHECDGSVFLSPEKEKGQPCGCPPMLEDRRASAKEGLGPAPSIEFVFRLAVDPSLGEFHFLTGMWEVAKHLPQLSEELSAVEGPSVCDFATELVTLTTKNGTRVGYRRPVVTVLGSPDTVAPEPPPAAAPAASPPPRRSKPIRRPQPPAPSAPQPTCSVDLDVALLDRAARALGTTCHRETVIAALSQAVENRQRVTELQQLRESLNSIATTAEHALRTGKSSRA
ncbi:hypothetical protein ACFYNY_21900 [Streptomyces sp. NPDC006530]|uniref:recombination directionality factor n=1 Tax=Streptomyces sp. NPDC006530 TaxID=3364750 RepID=UPI0036BDCDDB